MCVSCSCYIFLLGCWRWRWWWKSAFLIIVTQRSLSESSWQSSYHLEHFLSQRQRERNLGNISFRQVNFLALSPWNEVCHFCSQHTAQNELHGSKKTWGSHKVQPHNGPRKWGEKELFENHLQKNTNDYHTKFSFQSFQFQSVKTVCVCVHMYVTRGSFIQMYIIYQTPLSIILLFYLFIIL